MNRTRVTLLLGAIVALLVSMIEPAAADPVENIYNKFFGCEGMFQWPCPGPVIW